MIAGTPVSYTHLDVYKRQAITERKKTGKHPALITLLALAFQVHFALCSHDGFYIVGLTQSFHPHIIIHAQQDVFPVSYTHLDVYKRQVLVESTVA